jgi:hypothetical protein
MVDFLVFFVHSTISHLCTTPFTEWTTAICLAHPAGLWGVTLKTSAGTGPRENTIRHYGLNRPPRRFPLPLSDPQNLTTPNPRQAIPVSTTDAATTTMMTTMRLLAVLSWLLAAVLFIPVGDALELPCDPVADRHCFELVPKDTILDDEPEEPSGVLSTFLFFLFARSVALSILRFFDSSFRL